MNKFRFTVKILAIATFLVAFASLTQAQATRTWVSGVGDDVNPCSRTAPCKTFAGAISKTATGGEIDALDPAGYGAVTITKALTIDGGGGQVASVLVGAGSGIIVNAPTTAFVTLINLRIQGIRQSTSPGANGVRFIAGAGLNVINCYIYNFTTGGIDVNLNQTQNATVLISDSVVKNCLGDGANFINASTGQIKAVIERSSFVENGNGVHARNGSRVTARNSDFSLNNNNGIFSDGATAGGFAFIYVWASQITLNGNNGAQAGNAGNLGSSGLTIAQNQIDRNVGTGVLLSTGGAVNTFGNNSINDNGANGCVGCTPVGPGS